MSALLPRLLAALPAALLFVFAQVGCMPGDHEAIGHQLFASPQSQPIALSPDGSLVYVVDTTSNSVSILDAATLAVLHTIRVGVEPVSVAVRPDGLVVYVSNHVSDSVSVIDVDPLSATYLTVIATIQELDANGATLFDEPVGIAFASNNKAYVALSSVNDIVVIDAQDHTITGRFHVRSQEPRAIRVANGRLYVLPFESFTRGEPPMFPDGLPPGDPDPSNQCTLDINDLADFVIESPNIPGADARIVMDPDIPDRDLYVYSTTDESIIDDEVEEVGTLLYGLAVSSSDEVFVTQADARNAVNGLVGENLDFLDNRLFLNRIARIDCGGAGCGAPSQIELEPLPEPECGSGCGANPAAGEQLATPYGIEISGDDSTLVATAAASSRVFTVDASSGDVLDIADVGAIPRGLALRSDGLGAPLYAYVLNTLGNSVSKVDVSDPSDISVVATTSVGSDPTPSAVRLGRIAFNDAHASSTGTFSCASCHPDGNTDQLLWRIGGACFFGACTGDDEIRSTMPVRGLKNTLPLHWDGTLGDPNDDSDGSFGGNGTHAHDCTTEASCFRHLVDASLSGVMCDQGGSCPSGGNELSEAEKANMGIFLASVSYPPARGRTIDDLVTAGGMQGFSDFFVDKVGSNVFPIEDIFDGGDAVNVKTCADMDSGCHSLPLGVETDSSTLAGFDAPTMRGMTDRTLQFSLGVTNSHESLVLAATGGTFPFTLPPNLGGFTVNIPFQPVDPAFQWSAAEGYEEDVTFASAFPIFEPVYGAGPENMLQMFEEASTGFSGAIGRQVTLSAATLSGGQAAATQALLDQLEDADARGAINLIGKTALDYVTISYDADADDYHVGTGVLTRAQLEAAVLSGEILVTLTGELPADFGDPDHPQPLLSVTSTADANGTNPAIPFFSGGGSLTMDLRGIDVRGDAVVHVDGGVDAGATVSCLSGTFTPFCTSQTVRIVLPTKPSPNGLHLLQVQNGPRGPLSNELPICRGTLGACD